MAKKTRASTPEAPSKIGEFTYVSESELNFDPENPRLVEYVGKANPSQSELIEVLWDLMAVDEIAMSVAASGFWDNEPLLIVQEKNKWIVIEGNRRLAAVRLLLNAKLRETLRATDIPRINAATARDIASLPVIKTTRKKAWKYIGFKHVNGPSKWGSYAKAQYIATIRNTQDVPLEDIASLIGDKHRTVQRLYRALMVIEQAEKAKVFDRTDRYQSHFSFSHLTTGLPYEGIANFLSIKDEGAESKKPVPPSKLKALGEVCEWMFGSKSKDILPKVHTQNPHLRQLNEVLESKEATKSLRAGMPLHLALEISHGDEQVFQHSLIRAKESLQKARGTQTSGDDGSRDLLALGNDVVELANDLLDEMERKRTKPRRRRPN
jgi:hypothetical protein